MPSPRKQPTSSPRLPRGLELVLWIVLLSLVVFGVLKTRTGGKAVVITSVPVVAQTTQPERKAAFVRHSIRGKSSGEILLEKNLAAIEAEADLDKREEMLAALVGQIPVADIQFTLGELVDLGLADSDFSRQLLRRWAAADGHAAAAWAEQLPAGEARQTSLSNVAIEWANTSLVDAAVWARTLNDATERDAAVLAVANEAVRAEPVEALRLAATLPDTSQRDELLRRAAAEWTAQDPSSAVAWAEQIPDETLRAKVLAGEAVSWSEQNPEAAATLAVEKLPTGRVQDDAVISIVQRWAQQQPEAAAAWVEQFPSGPLRTVAVENLVSQWSLEDAEGARQWLAGSL